MHDSATSILGADAIAAVRRPIAEALGLPAATYTSEEFFRLEQRKYFRKTWMAAALTAEIADPGDAMPVLVAGVPLILVRNGDGEVRAFQNVCRHRGMLVVNKPCQRLKKFVCPYHSWSYDLDGSLISASFFDGTPSGTEKGLLVDKDGYGLFPVRCAVWNHWVFVNIDGSAPPIEEHMQPILDLMNMDDVCIGAMRLGSKEDWEFKANWKMTPDNWENYHHISVHKGEFTLMSDEINQETGELWAPALQKGAVTTVRRRDELAPAYRSRNTGLPLVPFPEGKERFTGPVFVYPNFAINIKRDNLTSTILEPVAPDCTIAKMGFFFVGDAADSGECADGREMVLDRWLGASRSSEANDGVRNQDMRIFEDLQIAKHAPAADVNVYSPLWEGNIHYFHNHLLDYLEA